MEASFLSRGSKNSQVDDRRLQENQFAAHFAEDGKLYSVDDRRVGLSFCLAKSQFSALIGDDGSDCRNRD